MTRLAPYVQLVPIFPLNFGTSPTTLRKWSMLRSRCPHQLALGGGPLVAPWDEESFLEE
jgi:hypothetical protein